MNTGFYCHLYYRVLEDYALGMLSDRDCAPLEEHLLVCSACQDLLADADEYIQIAKAAMALPTPEDGGGGPFVTDFRTRRRLSKAVAMAATLTGARY